MKSKKVAYLIWLFLGLFGGHKFYLERFGSGVLYLFTFGFFGIGWALDFFSLSRQVDEFNALKIRLGGFQAQSQSQNQSVVINMTAPPAPEKSPKAQDEA